ncbi:YD repeat-containing protein-containing protein [Pseudomonas syringae pv. atrofaciens]|uniref:RHS repeat-associated core domain-containing protein n=4 Tax=Pseudomonas syringae TaxID=317 RepID=A0AAD0IA34_PSESX|nr:RHS repeat-associated core domain-containing protein [Pseudomonas syringae]AVX25109.1 RHS repeat-associated core domain-containing protein [Pseudomonas syringae pv. atrofaciens]KPW06184.1 YD repeat-containing protein-containing protein [Pseudomonas syringae pv. atrofaciens]
MAILCKYTYDPLDRLSTVTPLAQAVANRFYNGEQLMTELHGDRQRTCIRAGAQLLAQQRREGDEVMTTLIASDLHNSVLHASEDGHHADIAYTPFGHHQAVQAGAELPGFNGEQPDPLTGHYLLGNGYRAYNPVLMRFNSPDSMSPFGRGGLNAYAYCVGDPVNRTDPTGHESWELYASFAMAVVGVALGFYAFPKVLSVKALAVTTLAGFGASSAATASALMDYYDVEGGSELGWAAFGLGALSLASGAMSAKSAFARGRARGPTISSARALPTQRPAQSSAGLQTTSFTLPRAKLSPLSVAPAQSPTIRRTGYPKYRNIRRPVFHEYLSGVHKMPTIAEVPSDSIRTGDELMY